MSTLSCPTHARTRLAARLSLIGARSAVRPVLRGLSSGPCPPRTTSVWPAPQSAGPAPGDLRLELARVPVGADMHLDVRFEAVTEGVLVTGSVTSPLAGDCARCLQPLAASVTASFRELYLYQHDKHTRRERRDENDEQDHEEFYLDGDLLDLEPVLRDAVVLALPMSPLCREDCPGLCVECGVPLADAGPDHGHDDATDPRWAALKQLGDQDQTTRRAGAVDLQEG